MAFDAGLAERVRECFENHLDPEEKKMFGGLAFMVNGHMCIGIVKETLMVRVGSENYQDALKQPHARKMDFTGKPLKGFIYVDHLGFENDKDLVNWVKKALEFNQTLCPK